MAEDVLGNFNPLNCGLKMASSLPLLVERIQCFEAGACEEFSFYMYWQKMMYELASLPLTLSVCVCYMQIIRDDLHFLWHCVVTGFFVFFYFKHGKGEEAWFKSYVCGNICKNRQ